MHEKYTSKPYLQHESYKFTRSKYGDSIPSAGCPLLLSSAGGPRRTATQWGHRHPQPHPTCDACASPRVMQGCIAKAVAPRRLGVMPRMVAKSRATYYVHCRPIHRPAVNIFNSIRCNPWTTNFKQPCMTGRWTATTHNTNINV